MDEYGAAVFPHVDADDEICGYELKNSGSFTGFSAGGRKGIWTSNSAPNDRRFVIAESGLDAISYAILFDEPDARYGSIGGKPTALQLEIVRCLLIKLPVNVEIVAAMDNDEAGPQVVRMKISGHKTDSMERRYNIADVEDLTIARELMERRSAASECS